MSVLALVIEVSCVACFTGLLLHRYGNWRRQHALVTVAAFMAWYFSLMIIFLMPIDVSNTCYRQCLRDRASVITTTTTTLGPTSEPPGNGTTTPYDPNMTSAVGGGVGEECGRPWSYVPPHILPTLWHVVYWTSQFLTWLLLPMMQSYAKAGEFSVLGKIKSALIANAIYYGTYLIIFTICLIYVAVKPNLHINGSQLKVLAITASNTWGLFLLVLLLGYGLVEVPRTCWHHSKKGHTLAHVHFKLAKLSVEKSEAEESLEDVLDDVKRCADTIRYNHPLRSCIDTILTKCPESVRAGVRRSRDDFEDFNPLEAPTEKCLVRLHRRVLVCAQASRRTLSQWGVLLDDAIAQDEVATNEASPHHRFVRSFGAYDGPLRFVYTPRIEWYWKCWAFPALLKLLTVVFAVISFFVVWSECLFFIKSPVLSIFALFIDLAKTNYNYVSIEFVSYIVIAYLCVCAYYTIFKIRIFNYYYLAAHHQTDENSLIFCGMLLCRLTPPLCLNFLGLIHLDSHITKDFNIEETSYTQIMGHMDVISFISDGFNIYFPIAIVLLCVASYFHLASRCLHLVGFQQFIGEDDITQELVDEGRELFKRELRRRQRVEETETRKRNWHDQFGEEAGRRGQGSESDTAPPRARQVKRPDTESDRTELLRQVEPVDYTAETDAILADLTLNHGAADALDGRGFSGRGYDGRGYDGRSYGDRYQATSGRYEGATGSRGRVPPPTGIFDDV